MRLSIITINYNDCAGLLKTIKSVISQTFKDFEWIVIDGGSSDGSRELIEQYADHFAYWVSESDKGIYNAMNKGIKVAQGEYLQFLNSGDSFSDSKVLEKVFVKDYEEDIIFSKRVLMCFGDGTTKEVVREKGNFFTPFNLIDQNINHQSAFIRRELFERIGYYDESYRIIADRKFFFDSILLHNAKTAMLDFVLVHYDGGGISSTIDSTKEKDRLIEERMPKGALSDYYESKRKSDYICLCQHGVDVFTELRKHWLVRKGMYFFYLYYKKKKDAQKKR